MGPKNIHRIIGTGLLVAVVSFLWTLVMPGVVAYVGGVYYREGILRKVPAEVQNKVKSYEEEQAKLRAQLRSVDDALSTAVKDSPTTVPGLLQYRSHVEGLLRDSVPTVSVVPFHLSPLLLLFPVVYTCLGWLAVIFAPAQGGSLRDTLLSPWFWVVGGLIYVLYEWPLWMRNFILSNEGRTVYAYPNFDVHPGSFLAQEMIVAGFCLLLTRLWYQWVAHYAATKAGLKTAASAYQEVLRSEEAGELRDTYIRWQISSAILALGFLFFTYTYWTLVAGLRDQRYLLSALIVHALWAASWVLLSMPLFVRWRHFSALHRRALVEASNADQPIDARRFAVDTITNLHPLSSVNLSVSAILSVASFVLPLLRLHK
jgi:hypothetical protein